MELYDPKQGYYVEDVSLEQIALDIFGESVDEHFTETVTVDGENHSVEGITITPESPFFNTIAVGEVDMGSRKNWVYIDIEQVGENKLKELLQSDELEIESIATSKNRFLTKVTGYEVSDLVDKQKESAKGYSNLSEV